HGATGSGRDACPVPVGVLFDVLAGQLHRTGTGRAELAVPRPVALVGLRRGGSGRLRRAPGRLTGPGASGEGVRRDPVRRRGAKLSRIALSEGDVKAFPRVWSLAYGRGFLAGLQRGTQRRTAGRERGRCTRSGAAVDP